MDRRFDPNSSTEPARSGQTRAPAEWLVEAGELADLIRAMDGSATPLGPRESWPESLRTAVGMVVSSRFPQALLWGRELVVLYNDAYRAIAGAKHPAALGRPSRDVWPEMWTTNEPIFAAVMERGETVYVENAPFPIHRHGRDEDACFTLCYSPVRVAGGAVGGTLVTLQETTGQLAEREHLAAEATKREAEAEAVLAAVADGVLVYDAAGRVLRSNAAADALLGFSPREQALPARERIAEARLEWLDEEGHPVAPEDLPALRAARHGETHRGVVLRRRGAGGERWFTVSAAPITIGGSGVGAVVSITDVTERRLAGAASAREHELLARLFEQLPVMIAMYDPKLGSFRFNAEFERVLGWNEEDAASGDLMALAYPDPAIRAEAVEHMRSLAPGWREFPVTAKDGATVPSTWANLRLSDDTQVGIGIDLRERRQAERAVRESEHRLRRMIDANPIGVLTRDGSGRVLYANDAYLKIIRATRDDLNAGRVRWDEITAPEHRSRDDDARAEAESRGVSAVFEKEYVLRDGTRVPVLIALASMGIPGELTAFVLDLTERKRAEEALRETADRFTTLADNMAPLAWMADERGSIFWYNRRWFEYTGTTLEETRGWGWRKAHHPEHVERVVAKISRCFVTGERWEDTFPLRGRDGSYRWFLSRAVPIRDAEGRVVRWLGTATDMTEQRRIQEALRESEQRFRAIFEDAAVGIVEVDDDDRFVAVNTRFCAMLGYSPEELIGRSLHDITAPEDAEITMDLNARGHAGELRVFDYEKRYLKRDGTRLWVHVTVSVVRNDAGRFLRAIGTAEDITERKRAESEARSLAQFPQENPNPVLRASTDGRVLYANEPARACLSEFGWREGGLLPEEILRTVRRVPEKGTIHAEEVTSPAQRVWSITFSASAGEGHVNAYGRDVTDRKRYEEELRTANEKLREDDRRKDEFLGMLSHELRNPLAPIRNALYILEHAEASGQQARRAKEVASRQLAHMTRLVDDLLDVTRIARGKIELRRADLDLAALARRTAEDHRALMHDRHLALDVHVPDQPVIVHGDETRVAQVLGNLLHNAAKFTSAGGRVTLAVAVEHGEAVIHVRDTGAGIAPEVLPTIFEPFTQAKQTLARSEGGLGLGLALVKGLVALHGGSVKAYSGGPGSGTEFVVTLPLAVPVAPARRKQRASRGATHGRRRRVLVIDDNHDAADSLAELVSMIGHDAEVAYDAFDALARAADGVWPEVVLCDIGLPGMDGYEFARQFRAISSKRPVRLIAVSGYAQPEDVAKATEAGFDAHVAKPPDPERLAVLLGRRVSEV